MIFHFRHSFFVIFDSDSSFCSDTHAAGRRTDTCRSPCHQRRLRTSRTCWLARAHRLSTTWSPPPTLTAAQTPLQLPKVRHARFRRPPTRGPANTPSPRADVKECSAEIVHNASVPVLVEAALQREKGSYLTSTGALAVRSGAKTGRSPKDKRIVEESASVDNVWWGPVNIKMEEKSFMLNREYATRLHRHTPSMCTEVAPSPLAVAGAPSTTSTCATGSSSSTATPAGTPSTASTCACSARAPTTLCS